MKTLRMLLGLVIVLAAITAPAPAFATGPCAASALIASVTHTTHPHFVVHSTRTIDIGTAGAPCFAIGNVSVRYLDADGASLGAAATIAATKATITQTTHRVIGILYLTAASAPASCHPLHVAALAISWMAVHLTVPFHATMCSVGGRPHALSLYLTS